MNDSEIIALVRHLDAKDPYRDLVVRLMAAGHTQNDLRRLSTSNHRIPPAVWNRLWNTWRDVELGLQPRP